jgi:hypothetical protein
MNLKLPDRDELLHRGKTDQRFLIETAFNLVDKNSKKVPFIFNPAQNDYWDKITERDLDLKARKLGFSSLRLARMIAKCQVMENRRCVVVSHEQEATVRLLERAKYFIKNCIFPIRTGKSSSHEITFPDTNSSIWIGTAGQKAFGRGDDITDYHLSEYAFWANPKLITGIEEACVKGAEGCIESTANGWGTPYHKLWQRAERGEAINSELGENFQGGPVFYAPHFYGWFWDEAYRVACPKRLEDLDEYERGLREMGLSDDQILWRRLKIKSMTNPEDFPQEYPATAEEAFLMSGLMYFPSLAIKKQEQEAREVKWQGEIRDAGGKAALEPTKTDPISKQNPGRLKIWISPKEGRSYLLSADVASGIEIPENAEGSADLDLSTGCYSSADVFDVATWEQVAQWHGFIAPDLFADVIYMLGWLYNWAYAAPEVNNHGLTTCTRLNDLGYPNLMTREDKAGGTDLGYFTGHGESGTRARMLASYKAALRDYTAKINSKLSLSEARSFVKLKNGKLGPQAGCFSDTVISGAIGIHLLETIKHVPEANVIGGRSQISVARRQLGRPTVPKFKGGYV